MIGMKKQKDGLVISENYINGAFGAFIGSLAGVIAIILFDMIGFVASIAGVIMGTCTIYMYERFAGSISKKGLIICICIMVIMVLVAVNLSWSIAIAKEINSSQTNFKVNVFDVFFNIYGGVLYPAGSYVISLLMAYGFTSLGAFGIIKQKFDLFKN